MSGKKKSANGLREKMSGKKSVVGLQKDMELELTIEDMGVDGEGIGKAEGVTLFVKDAVLGDMVRVKIMKMKKNYGYARLLEILKPSPYRVEPKCAFHRQCVVVRFRRWIMHSS